MIEYGNHDALFRAENGNCPFVVTLRITSFINILGVSVEIPEDINDHIEISDNKIKW